MTLIFTVEHKYCGMVKTIEGENVYEAYQNGGLDMNIWTVKSVERKN